MLLCAGLRLHLLLLLAVLLGLLFLSRQMWECL
jgi:hypothetical protein